MARRSALWVSEDWPSAMSLLSSERLFSAALLGLGAAPRFAPTRRESPPRAQKRPEPSSRSGGEPRMMGQVSAGMRTGSREVAGALRGPSVHSPSATGSFFLSFADAEPLGVAAGGGVSRGATSRTGRRLRRTLYFFSPGS